MEEGEEERRGDGAERVWTRRGWGLLPSLSVWRSERMWRRRHRRRGSPSRRRLLQRQRRAAQVLRLPQPWKLRVKFWWTF